MLEEIEVVLALKTEIEAVEVEVVVGIDINVRKARATSLVKVIRITNIHDQELHPREMEAVQVEVC